MTATLEATAPCRLELIDGGLETVADASPDRVLRLAVALDRRVFCRVEPRAKGVEIHSKDTGERVVAEDARQVQEGAAAGVARILVDAGVTSGVRVVTQVRVPEDAGLGTEGALEVAVRAAVGVKPSLILERVPSAKTGSIGDIAPSDRHAAVFGGAHVLRGPGGAMRVERVAADPARLEECLLLVDPGPVEAFASPLTRGTAATERVLDALATGDYDALAGILAEVHRGRFDTAPPSLLAVVEALERAGGAAWPCGRLVAVWAVPGARSPGPREAVLLALKTAGLRSFPARVDLRGLEVE